MRRIVVAALLMFFLLSVLSFSQEEKKEDVPLYKKVAQTYGIDNFNKIESVSFIFNVTIGKKYIKRKWEWLPKKDEVIFYKEKENGEYEKISYNRKDINKVENQKFREIDANFINDQYWLFFPFHLEWDKNIEFDNQGIKESPVNGKEMKKLVVTYTGDVGYTPNDVFELYIRDDSFIDSWVYRRGGSKTATRNATWERYKNYNGIWLSLEHFGSNNFHLWFDGVQFKFSE